MVSKNHCPLEGTKGSFGVWLIPKLGPKKYKISLNIFMSSETKNVLQNQWGHPQNTQEPHE